MGVKEMDVKVVKEVESRLRDYFARHGKAVAESFPCPIPQRIKERQALNRYIDHTLLKQAALDADYRQLLADAQKWQPFSVCLPPVRVPAAVEALRGSGVKTCSVVGFPWGYDSSRAKAADAAWLVGKGCDEVDMVISLGLLKDEDYLSVFDDIQAVVEAADGHLLKVILECSELSREEIIAASFIAGWAGAWFVKTSTGFASGGASLEAVRVMRQVAGDVLGVKASGGIRDRAFTEKLIEAGADRIGASATGTILAYNVDDGGSGY